MHPTFAFSHHRESQLSGLSLSDSESSGAVEASYFHRRHHMVPRDWPSAILRFSDRPRSPQSIPPSHHQLPAPDLGPQAA